jgi:regulator of replication initiation timing
VTFGLLAMHHGAESAAARLWRDKAERREQERNEAQAQTRIAEEKVAILTAENHRLAAENARLRAQLGSDILQAKAETEMQMQALRGALIPLLANEGREL